MQERCQQPLARAEVVADRVVITLTCRLADLPVGHRCDAVLGEEPFGGGVEEEFARRGRLSAGLHSAARPPGRRVLRCRQRGDGGTTR